MSTSQDIWSRFTGQLLQTMGQTRTEASVQVLPNAIRLPESKQSETALTDALNLFCNMIPQWGSSYAPSNQVVVQAYQAILGQIQPTPDASQAIKDQFEAAQAASDKAAEDASGFQASKIGAYGTQKDQFTSAGLPVPSWPDFWKPFIPPYKTLQAQNTKLADIALAIVKAQAPSQYIQARGNLNKWLEDHPTNPIPPFNYTGNPWLTLAAWNNGKSFAEKTLSFSNSTSEYDYSKSTWEKSSSKSVFFGVWKSTSHSGGSTESTISSSSSYDVKVKFKSQAFFGAGAQADWFNGTVLNNYRDGPWIKGSQFDTKKSHPYAQGGLLPLMVTGMYVIYNPVITIKLDQASYNGFLSTYNSSSGDGFNFGPFYKNPSSQSESNVNQKVSTDNSSQTITITDTSNVPQILATTNEVMPGGKKSY